ncbi:hypothetical protein COU77_04105 [Candidatus Peregrinibacteria bacterium CG10_big_fil_rev_8_21_14_0_10_49_16]|nr:MAG: hypothetical protein COW95_04525 [Candidatus Peregrinibacteria bacterium CG22_combo_CG10-13_8_21_14_all_49_11]PIR51746.1 MAG: hypothetical protein COU77_04105 [Candidatus Peregrinibacteria bacterium CG10_big_fil_rev_8_21_14_0_10_49_16]
MELHTLHRNKYVGTVFWALVLCVTIVTVASFLGRAARNLNAAVIDKPDIAIYLLLPEEHIFATTLLKEEEKERHYIAETSDGPLFVKLVKGEREWYVATVEKLH